MLGFWVRIEECQAAKRVVAPARLGVRPDPESWCWESRAEQCGVDDWSDGFLVVSNMSWNEFEFMATKKSHGCCFRRSMY